MRIHRRRYPLACRKLRPPYNTNAIYVYDEYGRLLPALNRFPPAAKGRGVEPLADYAHSKGLKFSVHLMRGMNKEVHDKGLPIKGTKWKTSGVKTTPGDCAWLKDNYGLEQSGATQAYYDSFHEHLAGWGVDFVKADGMLADFSRPGDSYYAHEIEMIRTAIDRSGRPMLLSLSPGPAPFAQGAHLDAHANMWRITNDLWEIWPEVEVMFDRLEEWTPYRAKGNWPADAGWTKSLLTNEALMEINQNSVNNRQLMRKKQMGGLGRRRSRKRRQLSGGI